MKSKTGKTNKSYAKRLKITKDGKALRRSGGQNHFNAKQSRSKQMSQKGLSQFNICYDDLKRYLPHI
jgi:ribosomal protein L35